MLSLVLAALVGAAPLPPPTPTAVAAASLLRATDELKAKDEAIATLRKGLKEPAVTAAALVAASETIASLAPDNEKVHVAVLEALMALAAVERDPTVLRQRVRTLGSAFVQRNPTSVRGYDVLATALAQHGDEEGQLRVLAACGAGCVGRFVEAQRVWQRVRCFGDGLPQSVSLRMANEVLASADEVAFIEPVPATAKCLVQLQPVAGARVAAHSNRGESRPLFLLLGITLISDMLETDAARGAVFLPAAACPRICKSPKPRPLPAGLVAP